MATFVHRMLGRVRKKNPVGLDKLGTNLPSLGLPLGAEHGIVVGTAVMAILLARITIVQKLDSQESE